MAAHEIGFYLAEGGQNSAIQATRLPENQYARGVNIAVEEGNPATRIAVRVIPMTGEMAEFFAIENFQGGMRFNPSEGQGAVLHGQDESTMLFAVGGRKLNVKFAGRGANTTAEIVDVSNGIISDGDLHLVTWQQWENFALAGDGNSNTWIWNGTAPAFASKGYNNVDKPNSEVPNGCFIGPFVHGRGTVFVNSRSILVGDNLNKTSQTSSDDVWKFVDQVYFATGTYFSPPTRLGPINAAAILPLKDTQHGHGEYMAHCRRGIFSIDLNVFPRTKWSDTPMVKIAHIGSGATGPYAVAIYSGDQLFRSWVGVQTLRSTRAQTERPGAPEKSIARTVKDFLRGDSPSWLRFASVETWEIESRGFVTCSPVVQGRFRWHRGFIVSNFDPGSADDLPAMWEGLWTLPKAIGGVVQFIQGDFDGENRLFAVCRAADGRNRLVEFRRDLDDDVLEDATRQRIRSQLVSRKINAKVLLRKKQFGVGSLFLSGVRGRVDWGIWVRVYGTRKWTFWRGGYVETCPQVDGFELGEPDPWEGEIPLGGLDRIKCLTPATRHLQFLIRWAGRCSVESIRMSYDGNDPDEDAFKPDKLAVKMGDCTRHGAEFTDYEYLENGEPDSWLAEIGTKP